MVPRKAMAAIARTVPRLQSKCHLVICSSFQHTPCWRRHRRCRVLRRPDWKSLSRCYQHDYTNLLSGVFIKPKAARPEMHTLNMIMKAAGCWLVTMECLKPYMTSG